jgi:2-dehydropantoate 2-reductase
MQKRILIFGAGVIGSTFGGLMAASGQDVTMLARNKRLEELNSKGLLLQRNGQDTIREIPVKVISELAENDIYDFVFVTLRKEQVQQSLPVLKKNQSQHFVFMVNNPSGYDAWTEALGRERVIPAFPGSGGKIENGVVFYEIVSGIIQPTTLGELDGKISERARVLKAILKKAGFNVSFSKNMDAWQKTHVAMVGPLGDVIYVDGGNNYSVAKNPEAIRLMNLALKENFLFLKKSGIGIEPVKLNMIRFMPLWLLNTAIKYAFNTRWAETVISNHALNARNEMKVISNEFLALAETKGYTLSAFKKMVDKI